MTFQVPSNRNHWMIYLRSSIPDGKGWGNLEAMHDKPVKAYFHPFFSQKCEAGSKNELRAGVAAGTAARPLTEPSQRPTPNGHLGLETQPLPASRPQPISAKITAAGFFFFFLKARLSFAAHQSECSSREAVRKAAWLFTHPAGGSFPLDERREGFDQ